jgi:hypothetical protein
MGQAIAISFFERQQAFARAGEPRRRDQIAQGVRQRRDGFSSSLITMRCFIVWRCRSLETVCPSSFIV